ncbi:MAG: acyl-CoA thioesterase [Peptococcaceae bacterium]|nr:acyl-CoA thioesterase [Peptococcaceae bacterium]
MYTSKKEIQITYADTDMMGIIYHANYLKWFELGRTELIKELGFNYQDMEMAGYAAPVYEVKVTYKKPVRYGDLIYVETWIEENTGVKTVYGYQIVDDQGLVFAQGTTTHIVVRKDNFKPIQFKKVFPGWFQKYEEIKKHKSD